jgi:predicted ATPase/class 3 adenylate cyclase
MLAVEPPVGTIAMLFTDIEGSTKLARSLGAEWGDVLARHNEILAGAIGTAGGWVDGTEGDAFFATFSDAGDAARAASAAMRKLLVEPWPGELAELRVRMALHVGHVERNAAGYWGLEVHRAARVAAAAHGGQLLVTPAARDAVGDVLTLEFVGVHRVKDFPAALPLYCAVVDGRGALAFPPLRTLDVRPTNLPAGVPSLVGRDEELAAVRHALLAKGERMVSVTGRGGSGKTTLALVAATSMLEEHPGGVWLVRLGELSSPDSVPDAIAAAVGADREIGTTGLDATVSHLRESGSTLLILDNMEHLVGAAEFVEKLLAALPDLRALITTQVPVRSTSERVIMLDALDVHDGLALLKGVLERRGLRLPGGEAEQSASMEIVRLLDGLPLALELAAARLSVLTPSELRNRLRTSLELLRDSRSARPARQRSLQATVDWTLGLLEDAPRVLFTRLGAFAGPVPLGELEVVLGGDGLDVVEALWTLVDLALVRRVESGDGRVRFELPEALRQIAAGQLAKIDDAHRWCRAHAERQLALLPLWVFCTTQAMNAALAADREAAAALAWARAEQDPMAFPLAARRALFLMATGRLREADALLAPLLASPPEDDDARSVALAAHACVLMLTDPGDEALRAAEAGVRCASSDGVLVFALSTRGLVHAFSGRTEPALHDHQRAADLARRLGEAELASALLLEAQALIAHGALEEAEGRLAEAERVGIAADAWALTHTDTVRGDLAMAAGRPENALGPYAQSLENAQIRGDQLQVLFDLRGIALALAALARDEEALEVHGLAEIEATELAGSQDAGQHLLGNLEHHAAEKRLGRTRASAARDRGRTVSPGLRVAVACRLARETTAAISIGSSGTATSPPRSVANPETQIESALGGA